MRVASDTAGSTLDLDIGKVLGGSQRMSDIYCFWTLAS